MKKLLLVLILTAFAIGVEAADKKAQAAQDKPACCAQTKATVAEGECPMAKGTCCAKMAKNAKAAPAKQALLSPKAASFAAK